MHNGSVFVLANWPGHREFILFFIMQHTIFGVTVLYTTLNLITKIVAVQDRARVDRRREGAWLLQSHPGLCRIECPILQQVRSASEGSANGNASSLVAPIYT